MDKRKTTAILSALLAAVFNAINVLISKILLKNVSPTIRSLELNKERALRGELI